MPGSVFCDALPHVRGANCTLGIPTAAIVINSTSASTISASIMIDAAAVALAALTIVCLLAWLVSLIAMHTLHPQTRYSIFVNSVSDYGVHPVTRHLSTACALFMALACFLLAGGLGDLLPLTITSGHVGIAFLVLFGITRALAPALPPDVHHNIPDAQIISNPAGKTTTLGLAHMISSAMGFTSMCIAASYLTTTAGSGILGGSSLNSNYTFLNALSWLLVIGLILMMLSSFAQTRTQKFQYYGLVERCVAESLYYIDAVYILEWYVQITRPRYICHTVYMYPRVLISELMRLKSMWSKPIDVICAPIFVLAGLTTVYSSFTC